MKNRNLKYWFFLMALLIGNIANAQKAKINNASALEFFKLINSNTSAIIIDVRASNEQIVFYIKASVSLVDKASIISFIDTVDTETSILVYCDEGKRSLSACELLISNDFSNVANLKHGFIDYIKKDYPVEIVKMNGL